MTDTSCTAHQPDYVAAPPEHLRAAPRRKGRPPARAGTKRDQGITLRFRDRDYAALRKSAAASHTALRPFLRDLALSAAAKRSGQIDHPMPTGHARASEGAHHDQAVTLRFSAKELDAFTEQATAAGTKIRPFLRQLILISARALHDPSTSREEHSATANDPEETNNA